MDQQQTCEPRRPRTYTRVIEEHRYWLTDAGHAALDRAEHTDEHTVRPVSVSS